jgi:hypothetical protein
MLHSQRKEFILACLKSACPSGKLIEIEAWNSIELTFEKLGSLPTPKRDQKHWADQYVFRLGVIYAHHTGSLPGFTNGDGETRFERFARAIMADNEIEISRNLIKAAIRRLSARQNVQFLCSVEELKTVTAAA